MALAAGTRLGPYVIEAPLGAGGMGEVYRAKDSRLDRTVAIKVLPEALAADPQFRERFEREAKAISSLNHPHICTLHDVGHQDGTDFLVMEYLEGETLAQRLEKGALSLDQALKYAIEVASALDKAHRAGIVHRDLKPGNVMLTKTGAKLLDFGLAKTGPAKAGHYGNVQPLAGSVRLPLGGPQGRQPDFTSLPTTPPNLTAQGTILGTFQYMAPEQIEGEEADARTDLFAFGVVLYEMLTGKKAFTGKTQASLFGAILKEEPPPIAASQPLTPPSLNRVVKKCLAKDPDSRWQTARDLCDELKWIAEGGSQASALTAAAPATRPTSRERVVWASMATIATAAAIALGLLYIRSAPATDAHPMRFAVSPPQNVTFSGANGQSMLAVLPTAGVWPLWRFGRAALCCGSARSTRSRPNRCRARKAPRSPSGRPTAAPSGSSPGTRSRPSTPPADRCARSATCPTALAGARGARTA